MYRIGLNMKKAGNYMLMDFSAPLCLTLDSPVGVVERLTPTILKGIEHGTLIDLTEYDDAPQVDVVEDVEETAEETNAEEIVEEIVEEAVEDDKEEVKENKKGKSRAKQGSK